MVFMDATTLLSELTGVLKTCTSDGFTDLADTDKLRLLSRATRLQDQLHGLFMPAMVDTNDCKAFRARKGSAGSSTSLVLASDMNMRRGAAGRIVNQAETVTEVLPKIHSAYCFGNVSSCQLNLLTRVADDKKYRKIVGEYENYFLGLCHLQYDEFARRVEDWCVEFDPTDPADLDAKAQDNRSLVFAQALDREVLGELKLPNAQHDQLMSVLQPFYDVLLKREYREAATERKLDESLSDEELAARLTVRDLARTRKQRYADALMIVARAAGVFGQSAREKLSSGEELSLADIDPGAVAQLIIVCDQETVEREIARRAGIELEPRAPESLAKRRCETLAGRTMSPAQAVDLAPLSTFRRMMHEQTELDFTLSKQQRFFTALMKLGMIVRDRTCATPGCGVSASRCEADHTQRFSESGVTEVSGGKMRCPACHRHKTRLESLGLWRNEYVDPETGARGLLGSFHERPDSKTRKQVLERERVREAERVYTERLIGHAKPLVDAGS